ncbi:MAG: hypothetical protein KKB38_20390 [Gammaproteobacteria bacterium]|nr:hypothetical protein [Gammaproteobacteria bacterium]
MIEYKQIFTDAKRRDAPIEQENFVRVTVYAPPDCRFPYLFEFEHDREYSEDCLVEFSLCNNYIGDAGAIRQAIKWLDSYEFKDLQAQTVESLSDPRD